MRRIMSDRYEARTKGLVAYKLNSESLTEYAREYVKVAYGTYSPEEYLNVEPLLLLATKERGSWGTHRLATLCTEGVGWLENEHTGLVPIYVDLSPYGGQSLLMGLHPRVVMRHITDEKVDLADWVRVFGDRLEINLGIWQNQIRGIDQDEALDQYRKMVITA
jgi:hypothetical protein